MNLYVKPTESTNHSLFMSTKVAYGKVYFTPKNRIHEAYLVKTLWEICFN